MKFRTGFAVMGAMALQVVSGGVALAEGVGAKAAYLNAFGQMQMTSGASNVRVQDVATAPTGAAVPVATAEITPVPSAASPQAAGGVAPVAARQRPAAVPPRPAQSPANVVAHEGLAFWVEVTTKDQRTLPATTDRVFQSGETLRLHFKPNATGYLYVFNKGSTGRTHLLYPARGEDNAVKAGALVTVPGPGNVLRIDNNPGKEQLVAVMSRTPLGSIVPAVVAPSEGVPAAKPAEQPLLVTELDTSRFEIALKSVRSKDIVLERDAKPRDGMRPATYAVAPRDELERGRIITVSIELAHK